MTAQFTTFKPEALSTVGSFPEAARVSVLGDKVAVMGHTRKGSFVLTNSYLSLVDVSDLYNPRNLSTGQITETPDADARGKLLLQWANDIKAVPDLPLVGKNNTDLSGDYIFTAGYTQWNFNGRRHRGRLGYIKADQLSDPDAVVNDNLYLSWNPNDDELPPPGVPYHRGEPMDMTIYGTNAYIANSGLGIQAVDLTRIASDGEFAIGGAYTGNGTTAENLYSSISRAGEKILALRSDELVILGTDLRPLGSFSGLDHASSVTGVEKYPLDIDGDGNLGDYEDWDGDAATSAQELFDLALVSTSDGIVVIDVTNPASSQKLDLIGNLRGKVKVDRRKRVGYASGGSVIFSLRHLRAGMDVSALDTAEDRVLYRSAEPGGAFDMSEDGSLLYAANGATGVMKVVKVGEMTTVRLVTDDEQEAPLDGAVTDGVSRLRIKITADNWQSLPPLALRLQDSQLANASASTTGTLLDGNGNPADSVPLAFDSQGVARVAYRAPDSFVRWGAGKDREDQDKESASRQVRITLNGKVVPLAIELKRPPVVLVHGLWSEPKTWTTFEEYFNPKQQFDFFKADYSQGNYSNAGPFIQNYSAIYRAIDKALRRISDLHFVVGKVDIVTHSMGGLLVREYCRQESLAGGDCKERIHKLITIDTPHKGSEAATVIQSVQNSISPSSLGLPEFNFDNPVCKGIIPLLNDRLKKQTRSGAIDDLATGSTALSDLGWNRIGVPSNAVVGITAPQVIAHNLEVKMLWTGLMVGCGLKSDPDMGINFDGLPLFGREVGQFLEIKISEGAALVDMAGALYESLMACANAGSGTGGWQELLDDGANCLVNGVSGVSNALVDNLRNFISALPQDSGLVMPALWNEGNDRIVSRSSEMGGLEASAVTEINHVDHLSVHKQADSVERIRTLLEERISEGSGHFSLKGF